MANKTGIDQEALIDMFASAGAKQAEAVREAVSTATLRALQGRELTLTNIRSVLKTVTQAASAGAAQNSGRPADVEGLLSNAFEGMDTALLQAVEANRRALQQFIDQGANLKEGPMHRALADLEKLEDTFFAAVSKAAQAAGGPLQGPWTQVLDAMKLKGSHTGAQAATTVEELMAQTQSALREGRAMSLRAGQALLDSYAALASGVLIGMSQGLQQGGRPAAEGRTSSTRSKR
jgi:hypothetical protein